MSKDTVITVKVSSSGVVHTIDRPCTTWGDVVNCIKEDGVKMEGQDLAVGKPESLTRFTDMNEKIHWSFKEPDNVLRLIVTDKEPYVTVKTAFNDTWLVHSFRASSLYATVADCQTEAKRKYNQTSWDSLSFNGTVLKDNTALKDVDGFWESSAPTLIGKYLVSIVEDQVGKANFMNVEPDINIGQLWQNFSIEKRRVIHTELPEGVRGKPFPICKQHCMSHCSHSWFAYETKEGKRELDTEEKLSDFADLSQPIVLVYDPPPFFVTVKEKDEKNQVIDTKIEISDHDRIADLKNKYSRSAEEGLVEGDMLLLDDQELKDDRYVFSYQLKKDSHLIVQKKSSNQPLFTYICADCGNDLRLRKDEKIRCRECGHRVVYKPRMPKVAQHFAR